MAKTRIVYTDRSDTITIGSKDDYEDRELELWLKGGSDIVDIYSDADTDVYLGSGNDMIRVQGDGDFIVRGGFGKDSITHYPDLFFTGRASMYGEAGDDYLSGQAGTDLLDGGEGNDTMVLGKGNTAIGGNGNDVYDLRGSLGEIEALVTEVQA